MAKILGQHIPSELKNLAINGAFDYWQRIEAVVQTVNASTTNAAYAADMWVYEWGGTTNKNFSIQQSPTVPTQAQSGHFSQFSTACTINAGIASPAAGDYIIPVEYRMEGLDYQRIHNKTVTFGFWVYATVPGTYSFALENGALTRTYCTTFTVAAATTWQFVTITIALDVSSSNWVFANQVALKAFIGSYGGTTWQTSSLNAWQAGNFFVASSATNWQATTGAVFQIAQFSIVEGPLGFSATGFQRAGKDIQQELALCQRYYEKSFDIGQAPVQNSGTFAGSISISVGTSGSGNWGFTTPFKVHKRTEPSMTFYNPSAANSNWWDSNNSASRTSLGAIAVGMTNFNTGASSLVAITTNSNHWSADAGL